MGDPSGLFFPVSTFFGAHMRKILLTSVVATFLLGGCTWGIKLDDAGRKVRTDWYGTMSNCKQLGKVTVSVADHLGPVDRNNITVRDELEVMARNEAGGMGGDTVHPLAEPVEGSQAWGVYQCGAADTTPSDNTTTRPSPTSSSTGTQTFPVQSGG